MTKRRYTLNQRAESQEETRRRIVEAAAHLHEKVGPRGTTISAIAKRAGVQRLTVYRHFPTEVELFSACTSHWIALNPPPDPQSWHREEGTARVKRALATLYRYYRGTEGMWEASFRDESDVPALREPMSRIRSYLTGIGDDLTAHLEPELAATESRRATLMHAVQFYTWQSLARQRLGDEVIGDLVCSWLRGAAGAKEPASVEPRERSASPQASG